MDNFITFDLWFQTFSSMILTTEEVILIIINGYVHKCMLYCLIPLDSWEKPSNSYMGQETQKLFGKL